MKFTSSKCDGDQSKFNKCIDIITLWITPRGDSSISKSHYNWLIKYTKHNTGNLLSAQN